MTQLFVNNFSATITQTFGSADAFLYVNTVAGLPALTDGNYLLLTLFRKTGVVESGHEVVKVTAITDLMLTVERAVEGAAASLFNVGAFVEARVTAGALAAKAPLNGDGASGTWSISITGSSTSAPWGGITGKPAVIAAGIDAAAARSAIGAQPADANLTAIAALTGTSGLLKKTAANTWELTESGGGGGSNSPPTLTYTFTGVMTVPPVSLPGTEEGLFASPSGNERANGVLLSSANYGLTGIEFTKLEFVLGNFNPNTMAALTSLSMPALTTVGGTFSLGSMAALTSLSMPALTTVGGVFNPNNMAALTSLSMPVIERIGIAVNSGNVIVMGTNTGALTTFVLPTTLKQVGGTAGNVSITSAALNQTSVDNILIRLAALDGTGGTVAFSDRTVTITGTSSAPSSTGLAAKATLVARGCTVTHN